MLLIDGYPFQRVHKEQQNENYVKFCLRLAFRIADEMFILVH